MTEGPDIAKLATLLADPSRARMLALLMGGQALTATELANAAGIGRPGASAHLARLQASGLLRHTQSGRHRYYRLADEGVAEMLEQLAGIAGRAGAYPLLTGPRDPQLREARVCYDHLAGAQAVALLDRLLHTQALVYAGATLVLGPQAEAVLAPLGVDLQALAHTRRPACRACLDWSVRREHLAGALGKALLDLAFARGWARRLDHSRAVQFTPAGERSWRAIAAN